MSYQEIRSTSVTARKEYRCSWCGEKIEKGLKHQSRAYVFEGDFSSSREHLECTEVMKKYEWLDNDNSYEPFQYKRGSLKERHGEEG